MKYKVISFKNKSFALSVNYSLNSINRTIFY